MIYKILLILAVSFTTFSNADELSWRVQDLGTLSTFTEACIKEFNDQGQALLVGRKQGDKKEIYSWEFWDPKLHLQHIDTGNNDPKWYHYWQRVNGQGVVIGLRHKKPLTAGGNVKYLDLITWQPNIGFKSYELSIDNSNDTQAFIANCRNSNRIIVSCITSLPSGAIHRSEVFSLINNQIQNLTPALIQDAANLGYDARDWMICAVNSQGMMLGRFDHYAKHPYKKNEVRIGRKYFLRDSNEMALIDCNELLEWFNREGTFADANHLFLDAKGNVLFDALIESRRSWESWIWNKETGLKFLNLAQDLPGGGIVRPIGLLDDGTIVWSVWGSTQSDGYIFEKEGKITRLPLNTKRNLPEEYLSEFPTLQVKYSTIFRMWQIIDKYSLNGTTLQFNANLKKQLFFTGEVFGEEHPFLIEPVEE